MGHRNVASESVRVMRIEQITLTKYTHTDFGCVNDYRDMNENELIPRLK